jgi:hypothetical protein
LVDQRIDLLNSLLSGAQKKKKKKKKSSFVSAPSGFFFLDMATSLVGTALSVVPPITPLSIWLFHRSRLSLFSLHCLQVRQHSATPGKRKRKRKRRRRKDFQMEKADIRERERDLPGRVERRREKKETV